jgi:hypothetical protein
MHALAVVILLVLAVIAIAIAAAITLGGPARLPPMQSVSDPFKSVDFSDLPSLERFPARDFQLPTHGVGAATLHGEGSNSLFPSQSGHRLGIAHKAWRARFTQQALVAFKPFIHALLQIRPLNVSVKRCERPARSRQRSGTKAYSYRPSPLAARIPGTAPEVVAGISATSRQSLPHLTTAAWARRCRTARRHSHRRRWNSIRRRWG